MKREIKFRLWDSENHKWFIKGEDGLVGNMVCCDSWDMFDPDDYVWCQYTGLKDKNGREIYESDIVRVSADGQSYVSVVLGPDGDYPAFDLDMKYIPDTWYYEANVLSTIATGEFEEMEVIGNVHQNPELLEVEVHDVG